MLRVDVLWGRNGSHPGPGVLSTRDGRFGRGRGSERGPDVVSARDGRFGRAVAPWETGQVVDLAPSFSGLGHRPLTAAARVRIPLGSQ